MLFKNNEDKFPSPLGVSFKCTDMGDNTLHSLQIKVSVPSRGFFQMYEVLYDQYIYTCVGFRPLSGFLSNVQFMMSL